MSGVIFLGTSSTKVFNIFSTHILITRSSIHAASWQVASTALPNSPVFSIQPPGLSLKITNGCSICPDAATVTATVVLMGHMVCDVEVLPLMVLAPPQILLVTSKQWTENKTATQTPYLLDWEESSQSLAYQKILEFDPCLKYTSVIGLNLQRSLWHAE